MGFQVELWIPRSRSPNLQKVVRSARSFDQFTEPADNTDRYRLTLGLEEFQKRYAEFTRIYEDVRTWKGTELRVNGEVGGREALNDVVNVVRCSKKRTTAVVPEDHCESEYAPHNWGCRKLTLIREANPRGGRFGYYHQSKYWFEFGSFSVDRSQWIVDKVGLTVQPTQTKIEAIFDCFQYTSSCLTGVVMAPSFLG